MLSDAVPCHHAQRLGEMLRGSWNRASGPERVHYFSSVADGMQASTPPTRLQQAEACRQVPGRQVWLLLVKASRSAHLSTSHYWAAGYSIGLVVESTPKGFVVFLLSYLSSGSASSELFLCLPTCSARFNFAGLDLIHIHLALAGMCACFSG